MPGSSSMTRIFMGEESRGRAVPLVYRSGAARTRTDAFVAEPGERQRTKAVGVMSLFEEGNSTRAVTPGESGEGGIRTLGTVARTSVFETDPRLTESQDTSNTYDDTSLRFAQGFAQAGESTADPDLTRVVRAWSALPTHIKSAVMALVVTAEGTA